MNKRLIVVLGMHRSGSSTITRALKVMGIQLGNTLLAPQEGVNPKGFWEDADINALNISMLNAIGSSWHQLAPIDSTAVATLHEQGYFLKCGDLLQKKTGDALTIFGFKDPRVPQLLPFWNDVFRQSNFDIDYILTVRHPLSIANSLNTRDCFDSEKSYLLWIGHVISSLSETQGKKRILVDYDRLVTSPDIELGRIATHLNLAIDQTELTTFKTEFLDPSLRHTKFELNDLILDKQCPPLGHDIYTIQTALASDTISVNDTSLLQQISEWKNEFHRSTSILALIDRLYQVKAENIQLKQSLAERDENTKRLLSSRSWLITKPFRWGRRALFGNRTP
jgi:hypothetical protein